MHFARKMVLAAVVAFLAVASISTAHAQTYTTYDLNSVMFSDGGTATGSFQYDPSTQQVGTFDITTAGGSSGLTGYTYSNSNTAAFDFSTYGILLQANITPERVLALNFDQLLPPSGSENIDPGTVISTGLTGGFSGEEGFIGSSGVARAITSGSVTAQVNAPVVPECSSLAALSLIPFAFLGLLIKRRRPQAAQA